MSGARALRPGAADLQIIDRCNLTALMEPGQEDLPAFLAQHAVRIVASLPCYGAENVDKQRGRGVFERSIQGLQLLNAVGYGKQGTGLLLDLVYNPGGPFLAPPASKLEPAYKEELQQVRCILTSPSGLRHQPATMQTTRRASSGQPRHDTLDDALLHKCVRLAWPAITLPYAALSFFNRSTHLPPLFTRSTHLPPSAVCCPSALPRSLNLRRCMVWSSIHCCA